MDSGDRYEYFRPANVTCNETEAGSGEEGSGLGEAVLEEEWIFGAVNATLPPGLPPALPDGRSNTALLLDGALLPPPSSPPAVASGGNASGNATL